MNYNKSSNEFFGEIEYRLQNGMIYGFNLKVYIDTVHRSPRQLAGEKKLPAIIINNSLGFPLGLLKS